MSYKLGNIYRIICLPNPDIQYVGSTFNELRHRWQNHIKHYEEYHLIHHKKKGISIFKYFDEYGIDNFKIVLIKKYLVYQEHDKDRKHLEAYEQLWINKIKCINEKNPFCLNRMSKMLYTASHRTEKKQYDKERRTKKFDCECGAKELSYAHKREHEKTKKHQAYLNSLIEI
jgi:hypothetical protein